MVLVSIEILREKKRKELGLMVKEQVGSNNILNSNHQLKHMLM